MRISRYLIVGYVTRFFARQFARNGLPFWSPRRWLILALVAVLPVKTLGFLTWRGGAWYLSPKVRCATRPHPIAALAIVAALVGLAINRERLPAWAAARLPI